MKEKKSFLEKVKEHKTEIIIAGVAIVSITGIIIVTKNWDTIKSFNIGNLFKDGIKAKTKTDLIVIVPEVTQNIIVDVPADIRLVEYSKHIRNLPEGWKPSLEKVVTALDIGIELAENQTWVKDYVKPLAA